MTKMNISQKGIDLIKSFEGLRLSAYKAVPTEKYYTIGYGHYGVDVSSNERITGQQAESLLKKDLQKYVDGVNGGLKVNVNQSQFDALVSFTYNCGIGAFKSSDMLKFINKGDFKSASKEFDEWIHSGGRVIQGLVNRRNKEQKLFDSSVPVVKKTQITAKPKKQVSVVKTKVGTITGDVWIHKTPDFNTKSRAVVAKNGTKFEVLGSTKDMIKVKQGYVSKRYIKI